ncbi:hypothetical protein X801_03156, partial [Opisthorchis viverrini]
MKPVTTISTHRGLFMFIHLPFGIHSAPSIFQRTIENVIAGIPKTFVYLDGILITGCTMEEHLKSLKLILDRLKECGLRVKKEKCDFLVDQVDFLGFSISAQGLAPLAEKIRPRVEAPQPRNKHELRSFLGMAYSASRHTFSPTELLATSGRNLTADALSRLPLRDVPLHTAKPADLVNLMNCVDDLPITAAEIRVETRKDPELSRMLRFTSCGWPENVGSRFYERSSELSVEDGCLLRGAR